MHISTCTCIPTTRPATAAIAPCRFLAHRRCPLPSGMCWKAISEFKSSAPNPAQGMENQPEARTQRTKRNPGTGSHPYGVSPTTCSWSFCAARDEMIRVLKPNGTDVILGRSLRYGRARPGHCLAAQQRHGDHYRSFRRDVDAGSRCLPAASALISIPGRAMPARPALCRQHL